MAKFFAELKRRHMYRVAAAYAVVAWVLLQLVNNLVLPLRLPDWVSTLVVVLLVLGFPVVLLVTWIQDRGPAEKERSATGTLDLALFGALSAVLVGVLGVFAYQQMSAPRSEPAEQASVTAVASSSGVSLAVLPFTNLSSDPEQEFFSDGMTEEITAALARVPDLRVVARTSSYQFRDQNRDIQSIGQQLHATHFIEGSVRKAGEQVRITVQLIKADDNTHVWAETYDRELRDIFAIQEDIARAITLSLRMPLGLKAGENLVANRSIDPESYQQYLRAKQLVLARTSGVAKAVEILEPLVARNPDFAPAWVQLARAYPAAKRSAAAKRAVELDPNSAEGYWIQAGLQTGPRRLLLAEELYSKALVLDPNNPEVLNSYGALLLNVGRLKEALPIKQQLVALEPFVPVFTGNLGEALWLNGQNDAALMVFESGPRGNLRPVDLARTYASMGRFSDAADIILQVPASIYPPEVVAEASRLLRMAPANTAAPESLPRFSAGLGFIYLYVGAPLRALEALGGIRLLWHPSYAPVRNTEEFKTLVRNTGLVDYWRERGWPEFCHPTTSDDFACS